MNYWEESLSEIFNSHGVVVSKEQLIGITKDVEDAANMQFEFSGHEHIPSQVELDLQEMTKKFIRERDADTCPYCRGAGYITENAWNGVNRSTTSQCWKCNGVGKIYKS